MIYEFELRHNAAEVSKNICCVKDEGSVGHSKATRWLKKFLLGCMNLDDQLKLGSSQTADSEAVLQAIEVDMPLIEQLIEFDYSRTRHSKG